MAIPALVDAVKATQHFREVAALIEAAQDLRESWRAGEGAVIENHLKRVLSLNDYDLERGLRALAEFRDYKLQDTPTRKKRRRAEEIAKQAATEAAANPASVEVRMGGVKFGTEVAKRILWALSAGQAQVVVPALSRAFRNLVLNSATWKTLDFYDPTYRHKSEGGGLPCPRISARLIHIIRLPRFSRIQILKLETPSSLRLTMEVCRAFSSLKNLKRVALSYITQPYSTTMLVRSFHLVEEARLPTIRDLPTVPGLMPSLTRLSFCHNATFPDWCERTCASFLKEISLKLNAFFRNLQNLFLRGESEVAQRAKYPKYRQWTRFGGMLTDLSLQLILTKAPALKALDVSFNFQLTGAMALSIGQLPFLRTLRWQHTGKNVRIEDLTLGLSAASQLRRLDLSFLENTPEDGMGRLGDLHDLRMAMPRVEVFAATGADCEVLREQIPKDWPKEECLWDFSDV